MIAALWHRLARRPHDWQFWVRLQDGESPALFGFPPVPKYLIVERCSFYPSCRAVRSYRYDPIVPDAFISSLQEMWTAPNPYRELFR